MHGSQRSLKLAPKPPRPVCPKCGKEIRLGYIVPEQPSYDLYNLRTFECVGCDQTVTNSVHI
jgi:hypothetical protein